MCYWKQWKKINTKHDELVKLGVDNQKAWKFANTRKSYWRISGSYILSTSLTNKYLEEQGFLSLAKRLLLAYQSVEPPYTERYVRWCGRTGANRPLLPDYP